MRGAWRRRAAGALTAALAALLAPAAPSSAAVEVRGVDARGYPTIRASVVTSAPSPAPPRVTDGGAPAVGLRAENLARGKSVALVVDRSGSMTGAPLAAARTAVRSFIARKAQDDRVAVVAVGARAVQLTPFSSSTVDAASSVRALRVDRRSGTTLYDGLYLASRSLAAEPSLGRAVILLTDGEDSGSSVGLRAAIDAARAAGAAVHPVLLRERPGSRAALERMARETGGRYRAAAASAALARVYADIRRELRRTWRLEHLTAGRPGERVSLVVSVPGEGSARVSAVLPGRAAAAPAAARDGAPPGGQAGALVAVLAFGAAAFAAARAVSRYRGTRRLRARLVRAAGVAPPGQRRRGLRERIAAGGGILRATERAFGRFGRWQALGRLLAHADLPLRPGELVYAMLGAGLLLGVFAGAAGVAGAALLAAFAAGAAVPYMLVRAKARRRSRAFEDQLPDVLLTLAASLKAGQSFRQGIQAIAEEGQDPAGKEFRLVLGQAQLGRKLEDGLAEMAERLGSDNFRFVISAVTIQREVGGSLAGIFDMVADTVRERQQFGRKIKALTATGRMSAYVLIALPVGLALMLSLINPEYMRPLTATSGGRTLVTVGVVLMAMGWLLLRRVVAFKG